MILNKNFDNMDLDELFELFGNKPIGVSKYGFPARLISEQNISEQEEIALTVIHRRLSEFLNDPSRVDPELAQGIVTAFEYVLQAVWKFPLDNSYHRYGIDLNGCTCPHLDNLDRVGRTNTRICNFDCKFHGIKKEN